MLLALLAGVSSIALVTWASSTDCGAPVRPTLLLAAAAIGACGSLAAAAGLFLALRREVVLIRLAVAVWAIAFFVAACLALTYVLSFFLHCPPS